MFSIEPFSGARGIPQLTGGRKLTVYNSLVPSTESMSATEVKLKLHTLPDPYQVQSSLIPWYLHIE